MAKKNLRDQKQIADKKAMSEASQLHKPQPEKCAACGEELQQLRVNSQLDMIACANRRCNLHRQRIRYIQRNP